MSRADLSSPRGTRIAAAIGVVLLHVAAVLALVRAFAPDFTARVVRQATAAFTVTISAPPPPPQPAASPAKAGAAGAIGRKATPKETAAPRPRIEIARPAAPAVAGPGTENASGAREAGTGAGAGGSGTGTGAGAGGGGPGGGLAARAEKISGDINSARDYPRESRDLRLGDHVIVALTVGVDGRVRACRVHRPSRDPHADQITCRLATERFRFRPATDSAGNPVESVFGWKQRWYDPREDSVSQLPVNHSRLGSAA